MVDRADKSTHFNALSARKLEHVGWRNTKRIHQQRNRILSSDFEHGVRFLALNVMRKGQVIISIGSEIQCVDTL
mgnify:CR=1 FL=1